MAVCLTLWISKWTGLWKQKFETVSHLPIWPAAASQDLLTAININTDKHKAKYQAMLC